MAISKVVYKASASATPVVWMDATTATAAAADITSPKTAMLANGVVTSGTGTGGGGTLITTEGIYSLDSGDAVSMASSMNGSLEAAKTPVLTNSWDFTTSLVDSVGGLTVTLVNGATQSSSGITISGGTQYATIPLNFSGHKSYELDIASASKAFSSGHGRLLMVTASEGFIAQNGSNWNTYLGGSWGLNAGALSSVSLNGVTLRIESRNASIVKAAGVDSTYYRWSVFKDGTDWIETASAELPQTQSKITIGAEGASFYDLVVTGFRVYDGVNY